MSVDLSMINISVLFWVLGIILAVMVVFAVFRFFFRHLLHFFFRGCGFILLVGLLLYILHILKVF